jgi:hypothetical protein
MEDSDFILGFIINDSSKTLKEGDFEFLLPNWSKPESPEAIGPFSSTNIFIGRNNSGKSRLLRQISKSESEMIARPRIAQLATMLGYFKESLDSIRSTGLASLKTECDKPGWRYDQTTSELYQKASYNLGTVDSKLKDLLSFIGDQGALKSSPLSEFGNQISKKVH